MLCWPATRKGNERTILTHTKQSLSHTLCAASNSLPLGLSAVALHAITASGGGGGVRATRHRAAHAIEVVLHNEKNIERHCSRLLAPTPELSMHDRDFLTETIVYAIHVTYDVYVCNVCHVVPAKLVITLLMVW
jgi:hypothetical protein